MEKKSEKDRIEKISSFLKSNTLYKDFIIIKALNNGQVIIRIDHLIAANKRGILLLDLESVLKKKSIKELQYGVNQSATKVN